MTATSSWRAWLKPKLSRSALPRLTGSRITRQRGSPAAASQRRRLGGVGRAVVEDEHLELRVVDGQRRRDADRDHGLLVVGGDQHGTPGQPPSGASAACRSSRRRKSRPPAIHSRSAAHRLQRDERQQQLSQRAHTAAPAVRALPKHREDDQRDEEGHDGHEHPTRSPTCIRSATRYRRVRRARGAGRTQCRRLPPSAKPGAAARSEPTRLADPGAWRRADLVSWGGQLGSAWPSRRAGQRTLRFLQRPSARMARRAAAAPFSSGSRTRTPRAGRGAPRRGARRAPRARQSGWRPCRCPLGPGPRAPSRSGGAAVQSHMLRRAEIAGQLFPSPVADGDAPSQLPARRACPR